MPTQGLDCVRTHRQRHRPVSKFARYGDERCATQHDNCTIAVILGVVLLFVLLSVMCPMLYFHMRHAYDLRNGSRVEFARTQRAVNARREPSAL